MNILICYDIDNDKRRKKIADLLETYGIRVNYSVFEIKVNKTKFKHLINSLKDISKKGDNIRIYHLCENCINKSFELYELYGIFEDYGGFI